MTFQTYTHDPDTLLLIQIIFHLSLYKRILDSDAFALNFLVHSQSVRWCKFLFLISQLRCEDEYNLWYYLHHLSSRFPLIPGSLGDPSNLVQRPQRLYH